MQRNGYPLLRSAKMEECELRSLWKSGQQTFQTGTMTIYINGSISQNASNGECYDSKGNRYGSIRRRLPGEKLPDDDEDDTKREDELEEKRKQKEKKVITLDNIEVVRGAVGFNRGVHRWEFIWKHDPYWSGKGDAVGICTRDSGTLGPQAFPCIGEDQYSWGIHCDGSVVHKGDVISAVSELEKKHVLKSSSSKEKKDINVVWCKDCVVTCVLDCEQHTFSIEINRKLVKDAVVKNLPSGVKFFPLISTCPAPAEEEDENDDEEMDNNDAEILELKEKKTESD